MRNEHSVLIKKIKLGKKNTMDETYLDFPSSSVDSTEENFSAVSIKIFSVMDFSGYKVIRRFT